MAIDHWKIARENKRNEERQRLLAISDADAEKMSLSDRYQRIRFLREIEAAEWLAKLRNEPIKPYAAKTKHNTNAKILSFPKRD